MNITEAKLKEAIQKVKLTASRITPMMLEDEIVSEEYHVFPGTQLTVCALTLQNGYTVTGESAYALPENFNADIGRSVARDNARQKIWSLLGFRLKDSLKYAADNVERIARAAHNVNRAYCRAIGDTSQVDWAFAPDWQRDSAKAGVQFKLDNPHTTPEDSHKSWLERKLADGWSYGPTKDVEAKLHPCMMPYAQLPLEQQVKDHLFTAVVMALST